MSERPSDPVPDGTTPIDPEDADELIPEHLSTRSELNQWEASNIARAEEWLSKRKGFDPLSENSLTDLHKQMFGDTWKWAGRFRRSDNNISPYTWQNVPVTVKELIENTKEQYRASDKSETALREVAMRFHHQLVRIHPWPNGNGRHARLATDALLRNWGLSPFVWGSEDLVRAGDARDRYIAALRAADGNEYDRLRVFLAN